MSKISDRSEERARRMRRIERTKRAERRGNNKRHTKSTKVHGGDDWLSRRELKRMVDPPDEMLWK